MAQMIDLSQLPAEIQALVNGGQGQRSPIRKPLTDLRPPMTAKGRLNRPHFEWSADPDPNPPAITSATHLFWDATGVEHAVTDEGLGNVPKDWTTSPPMAHALSAMERAQAELMMLSPEDRQFVLDAQKKTRLDRIREQLSGLSATDIAAILAANAPAEPIAEIKKDKKTA